MRWSVEGPGGRKGQLPPWPHRPSAVGSREDPLHPGRWPLGLSSPAPRCDTTPALSPPPSCRSRCSPPAQPGCRGAGGGEPPGCGRQRPVALGQPCDPLTPVTDEHAGCSPEGSQRGSGVVGDGVGGEAGRGLRRPPLPVSLIVGVPAGLHSHEEPWAQTHGGVWPAGEATGRGPSLAPSRLSDPPRLPRLLPLLQAGGRRPGPVRGGRGGPGACSPPGPGLWEAWPG